MAVIAHAWWAAVPAALCLATGLACLGLALAGVGDRVTQLTHAAAGLAMAGMLSPWGDPVPPWTGAAVFAVIGAGLAALVLRGGRAPQAAAHLVVTSAAMVLMYLLHAPSAAVHTGHGGAGGAGGPGGAVPGLLVLPLALLLAGYFAWHTWVCVDRSRGRHAPCDGEPPVRAEPVAHGAMSALMAVMFLGVL